MKDTLDGTKQKTLHFEIEYKEILEGTKPAHRILNAFEQKMEDADNNYLYLLFAADPYDTICFKIPNKEIENRKAGLSQTWDRNRKLYTVKVVYV